MANGRMPEPLAPQYDPQETEAPLYRWWEEQGFSRAPADSEREPYTIIMPPPNVTTSLHVVPARCMLASESSERIQACVNRGVSW
ncbi:hypothetical protein BH23GEM7_BH23GEM7_37200 [soil metagenome]